MNAVACRVNDGGGYEDENFRFIGMLVAKHPPQANCREPVCCI
jgi:hypothetical protein